MTIRTIHAGSQCENRTRKYSFLDLARQIIATHKQRHCLSRLDDAALKDLNLTRAQAKSEAAKPIWDVPSRWRRQK